MLLSQDFEINIYLPISSNETNEYDNWIINFKNKFPNNLLVHKSLPIQKLIKEICKYDFGINLSNINKSNLIYLNLHLMERWVLQYTF